MNYLLLNQYKELWGKFKDSKPYYPQFFAQKLSTQEDASKWSLELKGALETLAKENNIDSIELINAFLFGAEIGAPSKKNPLLVLSLARVNLAIRTIKAGDNQTFITLGDSEEDLTAAKNIIDRFNLLFDFTNKNDLFIEEIEENSVIIF